MATLTKISEGENVFSGLSAQTGMSLQNITYDYSSDIATAAGLEGETKGVTYFNQVIKISMDALVPASAAFSGTIASSIVLANLPPAFLNGGNTGGKTLIDTIKLTKSNNAYQTYSFGITYFPYITA